MYSFKIKYSSKNICALLIGALAGIQIRLLGMISLAEFVIVPIVFFLMPRLNFYMKNKYFKQLLALAIIWLASAILSDLFNQSSFENMLKGIGCVTLLIISLIFAYWLLYDNIDRLKYFLIGYALSNLVRLFIFPSGSLENMLQQAMLGDNLREFYEIWFTYYIYPLILAIVLVFYYKHRIAIIIFILLIGIYALFALSRSLFLIHTIVFILLVFVGKNVKLNKFDYLRNHLWKCCILFLISLIVVKVFYEYSASKGLLGETAYNKYIEQKETSEIGLLSGRKEFFIALYAIKDSPIWGFGSYALDKKEYGKKFLLEYDPKNNYISEFNSDSIIPTHSYIMAAWVYHGILGAIFWGYIIYILLLFFIKYSLCNKKIVAYVFLMIFTFLWDIFFSPGWGNRVYVALQISLVLICLKNKGVNNKLLY